MGLFVCFFVFYWMVGLLVVYLLGVVFMLMSVWELGRVSFTMDLLPGLQSFASESAFVGFDRERGRFLSSGAGIGFNCDGLADEGGFLWPVAFAPFLLSSSVIKMEI